LLLAAAHAFTFQLRAAQIYTAVQRQVHGAKFEASAIANIATNCAAPPELRQRMH
jgi:hypothetical protein